MTTVAHLATRIGDLLAAPLGGQAGWLLVIAALVFAVAALLLFKWATPQRQLAEARGRLIGRLYEAALYQTSLPVILRVQGGVLTANLRYLACALPAVAALVVPLLLVLPQLEARLGRRSLEPGETALVTAAVQAGVEASLDAAAGLRVDAGPVRDRTAGEVVWRVRALEPGDHDLRLTVGGETHTLAVPVAAAGLPALTATRHAGALSQVVFDPAGETLPAGSVSRFGVSLPVRQVPVLGLALPWIVTFTVLSLAAGLLLKKPLRVEL